MWPHHEKALEFKALFLISISTHRFVGVKSTTMERASGRCCDTEFVDSVQKKEGGAKS
jgi:hypothetical protein